ncbi:hypothetical protein AVEN_106886-1 [Araneus ventricosus]|uniref:Uncharacterized protein n=1 Tax=Araneus ventricosus TaxID=182803 RepID=A0A4Y2S7G2_ARAVE|nr:hypothetical protein AVEN_106886-1 [Araneus ventricosus]
MAGRQHCKFVTVFTHFFRISPERLEHLPLNFDHVKNRLELTFYIGDSITRTFTGAEIDDKEKDLDPPFSQDAYNDLQFSSMVLFAIY